MRILFSVLPVALLAAGVFASGQTAPSRTTTIASAQGAQGRLAPDAEARWVPFALTPGNQIRFTLMLDGRPLDAILDTGVSVTILSDQSRAIDPARLSGEGEATAVGGTVALRWLPTREVAFGGLVREDGRVAVARLPAIATASGDAVDVLVGADLLGAHALDIDYPGKRFRLIPSGRLPFGGSTALLTVSPARGVYESIISLNGRTFRPMVVDTGDGSAVTVTQDAWTAARLDRLPTTSAIAYGLAGPLVTRLAIVPALRIGDLDARAVEVRSEGAGGFSEAIGAAGRIGSGILGRYRVLLDPRAGRMVLSPGPDVDRPPLRSTSGLLLGVEPDRLKVLHVMANGPAEAAGWRAGEAICAIDGTAIMRDYPTNPLAGWSAGVPGRVVRLTLCDGGRRTLTLRRFY